jgi:NADP-dependent 3-hydroxy acid dehydrogenase YdfG
VLGPALTIRATLPHMLERGDGHYVITSSVAGRRPLPGSLYSATKFAATTIGEALRQQLRQVDQNDIAREVLHALTAPPGVEINEILIRPTAQRG